LTLNNQQVIFDKEIIEKYDKSGPRYTSYPTAVEFSEDFTERDYRRWSRASHALIRPLSLYFHIPFCDTVCFYCGCNKIVTKDRKRVLPYLNALKKEIKMQSMLFDSEKEVAQLHFGGGTPTFLNDGQLSDIVNYAKKYYSFEGYMYNCR
jgi:oxygen-independent coproporphyrinogen III oxidase